MLVVDDHPVVRQGLAALLSREPDFHAIEAEGSSDALRLLHEQRVDVVLVDLFLRKGSGLDLIKDIHYRSPKLPTVAMSMQDPEVFAERVLAAGGVGYIEKSTPCARIVQCLHEALRGEFCFEKGILEKLTRQALGMPKPDSALEKLSDRELEVFELYGQGLTMAQIAERLLVGRKTVETHRERIRRKLGVTNNTELIRLAASRQSQIPEVQGDALDVAGQAGNAE